MSQDELVEFLAAADIYITPYLQPEQSPSGTLAYAVGAGKAVISTPYVYARELLADGRGILVPWRDPQAIAHEVVGLLGDEARLRGLQARAAVAGQRMLWPAVARDYMQGFEHARLAHTPAAPAGGSWGSIPCTNRPTMRRRAITAMDSTPRACKGKI